MSNAGPKDPGRERDASGRFVSASDDDETAEGAADETRGATERKADAGQDRDLERPSHDLESREAEEYDLAAFEEAIQKGEQLEAPEPRPGFDQRWVAAKVLGEDMPMNYARQLREGWKARDPKTVANTHFPTFEGSGGQGFIGYAGLILMERPKRLGEVAREVNRRRIDARTQSIRTQIEEAEEDGHPISVTHKTQVELGRQAVPQEDDF